MKFARWTKRDPLVVTLLPTANLRTAQEQADEDCEIEWRKRVAENVRVKGPERQRKIANLRLKCAETRTLRYLKQAG